MPKLTIKFLALTCVAFYKNRASPLSSSDYTTYLLFKGVIFKNFENDSQENRRRGVYISEGKKVTSYYEKKPSP